MAVLGSVLTAIYRSEVATLLPPGLPAAASAEAGQTLAGAVAASSRLPGQGDAVLFAGRAAYTTAMYGASLTAATVLVVAATVTLTLLRGADLTLTRREVTAATGDCPEAAI